MTAAIAAVPNNAMESNPKEKLFEFLEESESLVPGSLGNRVGLKKESLSMIPDPFTKTIRHEWQGDIHI